MPTCFSLTLPSPPSARESRRKQGEEPACISIKPDLDFSGLIKPKHETEYVTQKKLRLFWSCMQNIIVC